VTTPWSNQTVSLIVLTEATSGFTGIFLYAGAPTQGNLVGSWSVTAGTDPYGNDYPAGLYVAQGSITGTSITGATLMNCVLQGDILTGTTITQPVISGGTATAQEITFTAGAGGEILVYSSSTTTATLSSGTTWVAPAGTYTSGLVECWGPGAGGDGGSSSAGGMSNGSGEYAAEPNYPLVPGQTYNIQIGLGGTGGTAGNPGLSGSSQTSFDGQGVVANPGLAGTGSTPGAGGTGSVNTTHRDGHAGTAASGGTGGSGGPGSPGSTGAGGAGAAGSGASGGAAGSAGTGGGAAGGAGGNSAANGAAGSAPGAAGGGAGASSGSVNISKSYRPTSTQSYYGAGVGGGLKNTNGYMYQGDPNVPVTTFPGDQASIANYSHAQIASDFSGATIDSVTLAIFCAGSWYNSGCFAVLGYYDGSNHANQQAFWCSNGATTTADITAAFKTVIATSMLGLILGPSSSTSGGSGDLWNYGYFNGGPSLGPLLSITGHTGSTPKQAGAGANGQIKVTYSTSQVLIAAIAPAAGADASGNAYGAGFTGQIKAFHPTGTVSAVETWQTLGTINSWAARGAGYCTPRYRLTPDNEVEIQFELNGTTTASSVNVATLPAAYTPTYNQDFPCGVFKTGTAMANPPAVGVANNGTVTIWNLNGTTTLVQACVRCPLD